jgi:hypothetical protein
MSDSILNRRSSAIRAGARLTKVTHREQRRAIPRPFGECGLWLGLRNATQIRPKPKLRGGSAEPGLPVQIGLKPSFRQAPTLRFGSDKGDRPFL